MYVVVIDLHEVKVLVFTHFHYKDEASECPALVTNLKTQLEAEVEALEPDYTKYANFPSCSQSEADWADR